MRVILRVRDPVSLESETLINIYGSNSKVLSKLASEAVEELLTREGFIDGRWFQEESNLIALARAIFQIRQRGKFSSFDSDTLWIDGGWRR